MSRKYLRNLELWLTCCRWRSLLLPCIVRPLCGTHPVYTAVSSPRRSSNPAHADPLLCSGTVFVIITILYARLFVFLRRPDKIRSPYSESPTSNSYTQRSAHMTGTPKKRRRMQIPFRRSHHSQSTHERLPDDATQHVQKSDIPQAAVGDQGAKALETGSWQRASDTPPWEKVDLPAFKVDGQTYGGSATNHSTLGSNSGTMFNWRLARNSKAKRKSHMSELPTNSYPRQFGSGSFAGTGEPERAPLSVTYNVSPSALTTPIQEDPQYGRAFQPTYRCLV